MQTFKISAFLFIFLLRLLWKPVYLRRSIISSLVVELQYRLAQRRFGIVELTDIVFILYLVLYDIVSKMFNAFVILCGKLT